MSESLQPKKSKKTAVVIGILCAIIIFCIIAGGVFMYMASTDNIYKGISVGKVDLSGKTKSQAIRELAKAYDIKDINVRVNCEGTEFDIYGSAFSLKADYEATADKALSYGKDENIFSKTINMIKLLQNKANIDLIISGDYNVLQYAINEKLGEKVTDVEQYRVEFGEDELIVFNGKKGRLAPAQKLLDLISKAAMEDKLSEVISLNIEDALPDRIDIDEFIKEYNREAKDAFVTEKGEEIVITPEVVGVELDADKAREILKKNVNSTEGYRIPAKLTQPEVTAAQLEAEYLDTIIGTYSTDYSTSSANRKANIHLASSKINGISLNPGEVFSFNNVVGPRTSGAGYKIAHVYSGGKVIDGIGGGICQVSSTLYNAAVLADLEIAYRTNHSMPVSYVPLGRDATVSYGSIDFKIKNNKETPVKIEIIGNGSTLTVNIYGRGKYLKEISVESVITGYIPFGTVEIKDDTMYEGESRVEEAGSNGTKVETYKIIKENGEVVSRKLLAKSSYTPISKEIRVGTKKKEVPPLEEKEDTTVSAEVQTPPPQTVPTDANIEIEQSVLSSAEEN